jgi:hypothetical protein
VLKTYATTTGPLAQHQSWPTEPASAHGPRGGRGASARRAGAAVADRIPTPAVSEVGRGRWLGQHGEMGNSFEAHRRG